MPNTVLVMKCITFQYAEVSTIQENYCLRFEDYKFLIETPTTESLPLVIEYTIREKK